MSMVNINTAISMAGVSRATFYKQLKAGIISRSKDEKGKPAIDIAELLRVYPNAKIDENEHEYRSKNTENWYSETDLEYERIRVELSILKQINEDLRVEKAELKLEVNRLNLMITNLVQQMSRKPFGVLTWLRGK